MLNRVTNASNMHQPRRRLWGSHFCDLLQTVSSLRAPELGVTGCGASHGSQKQSVQKGKIKVSMEVQDLTRNFSVFYKVTTVTAQVRVCVSGGIRVL
jgi:hypothetical protein